MYVKEGFFGHFGFALTWKLCRHHGLLRLALTLIICKTNNALVGLAFNLRLCNNDCLFGLVSIKSYGNTMAFGAPLTGFGPLFYVLVASRCTPKVPFLRGLVVVLSMDILSPLLFESSHMGRDTELALLGSPCLTTVRRV